MIEIKKLGVIGNCRSAALVSADGAVVWCCLPDFDSPSVFARLLDERRGGELAVEPVEPAEGRQSYIDRTNVLKTVFETEAGSFEVVDFMPIYAITQGGHNQAPEVYRLIRPVRGRPAVRVRYRPRLNYALDETKSTAFPEYIKSFTVRGEYHSIYTYTNLPFDAVLEGSPVVLDREAFVLVSYHQKITTVDLRLVTLELERTVAYWLNWVARTEVFPRYQEQIIRSALALKLLTYAKTGAVIAAVTTSLPEEAGGRRNWDYRYSWIRDSAMILRTLHALRHGNTARQFLRFLLGTVVRKADTMQVLYGIRGERELPESRLFHLSGYRGARPVRIGNSAYRQKQNDIYGVLMDLIYTGFLHFPAPLHVSEELWTTVRYIMRTVADNWRKPDRGIWEIRKSRRHFTFSKVLSWVAADRAAALAGLVGRNEFVEPWTALREAIRNDVEEHGWNEERRSYTQSYGSEDLDASLLLLEKVGYCAADSPRYVSTVRAVHDDLCRDGLMYRYRNKDDFGAPRSAFVVCSFWMAEALHKIGETGRATDMFERLLGYANPLGLYAEDLDFETREPLGNFPQGYSHLALIDTAVRLNGGRPSSTLKFVQP